MSSHFYLASRAPTTDHVAAAQCPQGEGAKYLGVTPLELSTLWAILEQTEWDVKMMRLFPIIVTTNIGDQIVHEIPPAIVTRLSALRPEEIDRVATVWAATVEMAPRANDVQAIVETLVRLAGRAWASGRGLFLANRFERR